MGRLTRTILFYGIIGALVVGALMVAGMMAGGMNGGENGLVVGYLTQLIALTVVFLGIKQHRDNVLGGVIKFLPAFGIGVAISAIASLGWVIAWEIVQVMSGIDYGAMMLKSSVEQARASGASDAEIQKITTDMTNFAEMYKNLLVRAPMTFVEMFPVGVLVSLICAGLLRNSRFMPARPAAA
jgi:hypothetical protein